MTRPTCCADGPGRGQRWRTSTYTLAEVLEVAPDWVPPPVGGGGARAGALPPARGAGFRRRRALMTAAGMSATVPDSGCCGLAGNFGFERGHYEVSQAVGERVLLPAVRAAAADTAIVADGFSCRTQIARAPVGTPRHLAQVLADALQKGIGSSRAAAAPSARRRGPRGSAPRSPPTRRGGGPGWQQTRAQHHYGHAEVASDESAVTGRRPATRRMPAHPRRPARRRPFAPAGSRRGLERRHLHRHRHLDVQATIAQPQRLHARARRPAPSGDSPGSSRGRRHHAFGGHDGSASAAVDLPDATGRGPEQGVGPLRQFARACVRSRRPRRPRRRSRSRRRRVCLRDRRFRGSRREGRRRRGRRRRLQVGGLRGDAAQERRRSPTRRTHGCLSRLLLVDQRRQFDGTAQPRAAQRCDGRKTRRQTTFHVGGAAAVDPAVLDGTAERIFRPALADRHDVGMAEQQQARARRHPGA